MRARDFLTGVKALLTYVTSIYHFEHKAKRVVLAGCWLLCSLPIIVSSAQERCHPHQPPATAQYVTIYTTLGSTETQTPVLATTT